MNMCVCLCVWYICVHKYVYICHNECSFIRANAETLISKSLIPRLFVNIEVNNMYD